MHMRYVLPALLVGALTLPSFADSLNFDAPLSGWTVDRHAPAAFQINSTQFAPNNVLQESIAGSDYQSNNFDNKQGEGHNFSLSGATQTFAIQLYVDTTGWSGQNINAGFWSVGNDASNAISAYPIIAYIQGTDATGGDGFYTWDYINGGYSYLGGAAANAWNDLSITLNLGTGVTYTANGHSASIADTATTNLNRIILNDVNYRQDYTTYWDNVQASAVPLPASFYSGLALLATIGGAALLRKRVKTA